MCAIDQTPLGQPRLVEAPAVASRIRRKIPLPLSIVSCYLIASGIFQLGLSVLIAPYLGGIPVLNVVYGVLILVVSGGLRSGLRHWHICALAVCGLVILRICVEFLYGLMHSVSFRVICLFVLDFAVWLWVLGFLTRRDIREFFYGDCNIAT
jgi:hypothetical protein